MNEKDIKLKNNIDQRVKREAEEYRKVLENRQTFGKVVKFANAYSDTDIVAKKTKEFLLNANNKNVLEIGSTIWFEWFEKNNIIPFKIHAINITEEELEKGKKLAINSNNKPVFHIMDAHDLLFDDDAFDVVFGKGILHHLDLPIALNEIKRVLKPNGIIIFLEPMNINPFSKVFRHFTPSLRTFDEEAFGFRQLKIFENVFSEIKYYPSQLIIFPFGVISKFFFKKAKNPLTYIGKKIDDTLFLFFPFAKFFYRKMLIICYK